MSILDAGSTSALDLEDLDNTSHRVRPCLRGMQSSDASFGAKPTHLLIPPRSRSAEHPRCPAQRHAPRMIGAVSASECGAHGVQALDDPERFV
ncbi:hypothetical protein C8F01DRAFT_1252914 [Mycena amicta]|nr:hypothetical protein C8F01DRAFT_1252914 [Mycena amicta]